MRRTLSIVLAWGALGCSDPAPRYGTANLSAAAPRLMLSGTTFGESAAMELAPGCPGYLDPSTPSHRVHVQESLHFTISALSDRGPLAIAVARGDEVRCDSDEGSGHAPAITLDGAGDYLVYVASLRQPEALPYEVHVAADAPVQVNGAGEPVAQATGLSDVNVTITSQPAGATVRDAGGNVVGTTPAMFVLSVPASELGHDRAWALELAGYEPASVTGRLNAGALVMHGQLSPVSARRIELSADGPQAIRDYHSASLGVDVSDDCSIADAEVEVELRHSFIGDLRILLHPPTGEDISLHRHGGGGRANLHRTWRMDALSSLAGHSTRGRWELIVHDDAGADEGTLDRFTLRLTCSHSIAGAPAPPPPQGALAPTPLRTEIVTAMSAVRPAVERCGDGSTANVITHVTFLDNGSVRNVSATQGSAELRQCVEQAVMTAHVSPFTQDTFEVSYPFAIPTRNGAAPRDPVTGLMNPFAQRAH